MSQMRSSARSPTAMGWDASANKTLDESYGTCTATTLELGITDVTSTSTTRSVTVKVTPLRGNAQQVTLSAASSDVDGAKLSKSGKNVTWNPVTHGKTYTYTAQNTDGYNVVTKSGSQATPRITATVSTSVSSSMPTRGICGSATRSPAQTSPAIKITLAISGQTSQVSGNV
ncbi:MAG: hypothetical protein LBH13_09580, partial [Cellulomonadaceae bacterium]|nr:hypothetical protein [Cellulomonadaceae bacterium]